MGNFIKIVGVMVFLMACKTQAFDLGPNGRPADRVIGQLDFESGYLGPSSGDIWGGARGGRNGLSGASAVTYDPYRAEMGILDNGFNNRIVFLPLSGGIQNGKDFVGVIGQTDIDRDLRDIPIEDVSRADIYNAIIPEYGCTTEPNACSFGYAESMAVDPEMGLYVVADSLHHRVTFHLRDPDNNGTPAIGVLGKKDFVTGFAVAEFTDDYNADWHKYANTLIPENGCTTVPNGCSFDAPVAVALDIARKYVFVSDDGNNRVLYFYYGDIFGSTWQNGRKAIGAIAAPDMVTNMTNGLTGSSPQNRLADVSGLAYDQINDMLIVVNKRAQRLYRWYLGGTIQVDPDALDVIGAPDFLTVILEDIVDETSIFDPLFLSYSEQTGILMVADFDDYLHRATVWNLPESVNGGSASYVFGQKDFYGSGFNTSCDGLTTNTYDVNACGLNRPRAAMYIEEYDIYVICSHYNSRCLIHGNFIEDHVNVAGDAQAGTVEINYNSDDSVTVSFDDTGGDPFAVTFPPGTEPSPGQSDVVITAVDDGGRTRIKVEALLPGGSTKSVTIPIGSAYKKKICIKDEPGAEFGGDCPKAYRVELPAVGTCDDRTVSGGHSVEVCVSSDEQFVSIDGLLHTVVETLTDSDNDGVEDEADDCPNTDLNGPIPTHGLRMPWFMGDNETIRGCNATQILECKGGCNHGAIKHGLSWGLQRVFRQKRGWAANCPTQ